MGFVRFAIADSHFDVPSSQTGTLFPACWQTEESDLQHAPDVIAHFKCHHCEKTNGSCMPVLPEKSTFIKNQKKRMPCKKNANWL